MKDPKTELGTAILTIILVIFIIPFLAFWLCYFMGWISSLIIGKHIVAAFAIFGINITTKQIPLIAGLLGWLGSFFTKGKAKSDD